MRDNLAYRGASVDLFLRHVFELGSHSSAPSSSKIDVIKMDEDTSALKIKLDDQISILEDVIAERTKV